MIQPVKLTEVIHADRSEGAKNPWNSLRKVLDPLGVSGTYIHLNNAVNHKLDNVYRNSWEWLFH